MSGPPHLGLPRVLAGRPEPDQTLRNLPQRYACGIPSILTLDVGVGVGVDVDSSSIAELGRGAQMPLSAEGWCEFAHGLLTVL